MRRARKACVFLYIFIRDISLSYKIMKRAENQDMPDYFMYLANMP